jgi:hypothetical protein
MHLQSLFVSLPRSLTREYRGGQPEQVQPKMMVMQHCMDAAMLLRTRGDLAREEGRCWPLGPLRTDQTCHLFVWGDRSGPYGWEQIVVAANSLNGTKFRADRSQPSYRAAVDGALASLPRALLFKWCSNDVIVITLSLSYSTHSVKITTIESDRPILKSRLERRRSFNHCVPKDGILKSTAHQKGAQSGFRY